MGFGYVKILSDIAIRRRFQSRTNDEFVERLVNADYS